MGDVAAAAGVSQQTVSRVVNNSDAVRKKTVDKVLKAMADVGYSPNVAARSLRLGRMGAVGVLVTDLSRTGELRTVQAIVEATRRSEFAVVLDCLEPTDDLVTAYRHAMKRMVGRVDGFIVEGLELSHPEELEVPPGAPVVVAGPPCRRFSTVGCDQAAGVSAAVNYLLALGHRTVHLISGPDYSHQAAVRRQAWQECLEANNCEIPDVITGGWTASSGRDAARYLKTTGATAVLASNDEMAAGVIIGLLDMGIRVPDDISVVGFDDVLGDAVWPTLSTVRQDFAAIGQRLVEELLAQLQGAPKTSVMVPAPLVVRASTAPPQH
ncbi:LacI family DNA-binding transcriptional regulator [Cutibacterium sp. WCA-380-WT-3A]|uniref:LacI family DNA-binding transcriptional regulator n=1 Tax=Cutibacterium porci TaxID=2605781 RepID=A0A7K0J3K2_9ACTN|nr:LacI family DNA-binding transcriptional regulator [Cutibacterium porci]MSS44500.1 LacI family DNA-binding transcriptional regulator [Cutibacterium porci]